jgi:hypothetical protein
MAIKPPVMSALAANSDALSANDLPDDGSEKQHPKPVNDAEARKNRSSGDKRWLVTDCWFLCFERHFNEAFR